MAWIDTLGATHPELARRAGRVAYQLQARGVGPGQRVGIYSENRAAWIETLIATHLLGAIALPINVLYRAAELEHITRDADPSVIVVSESVRAQLAGIYPEQSTIATTEIDRWATSGSSLEPIHVRDEDAALIIYTSGTTGTPKGAVLTHGNVRAITDQLAQAWRITADDTLLLTLPLFHVHGLCAGLMTVLSRGGRLILRERFDRDDVVATLERGEATLFFGVPTMYVRLLESAMRDARGVRLFVSGSAALPADIHRAFAERFGHEILERYGSTEFGFALSNPYDGPRVPGYVGQPLPGVRARIIDPETCEDRAPGEVGELLIAGPNLFAGYWRNDEATRAATIVSDHTRWFRTGDLAAYTPELDAYRIAGRRKELIISGGFNIYPREVEDELVKLPGVLAAAVVGRPDPARGELPVAFLEVEPGAAFDASEATQTLATRLASFKIPKSFTVIDALPRNALGKIEKHRL